MELPPLLRILLVEDNEGDSRLLQEALRASGLPCQVSVAEDGDQALGFLCQDGAHTTAPRLDIIILDLHLPKLDGHEVLRTLRATPEWNTIPVMIFSGSLQEADYEQAAALGATRCLQKPMDLAGYMALGEDIATWWRLRPSPS
jgi:two-component system, chemotaxis family, response regulator Rcp1